MGLLLVLLLASAAAQTGEQAQALARRGEIDEIRWRDPAKGPAFRVGIVRALPAGLEVQRGAVRRVLSYDQIGGVQFGLTMGERQLLAAAGPEQIAALRVYWEAWRLTLKIPGSNAGDFGLALARALRGAEAGEEARSIVEEIAAEDQDERRRARARAEGETLDFAKSIHGGASVEVEKRAWAIIEAAEETNPDLMLLVTGFLVTREFDLLKQIESGNPRWMEDDEIKPERDRHYHRALDLALYPSLFHPLRETESARGLWQASQIYQHSGETVQEAGVLEDLVALYGNSDLAGEAGERLVRLKSSMEASPQPGEPVAEKNPPGEAGGKEVPPPPKRYNLFED